MECDFGQRLRSERLARELSLSDLARRVRVTKGYLSRLESGKAKPSRTLIARIAKTLKVEVSPLCVSAGYLPSDVKRILYRYPVEAPLVLREAFGEYVPTTERARQEEKTHEAVASTAVVPAAKRCEGLYEVVCGDCFDWMERCAPNSIHAIVTDPPYGLKEYTSEEKEKLRRGRGGVWRIPPTFDGCARSPLPRFTVLRDEDRTVLRDFFARWATRAYRILVPGGHVFIATNPLVSHIVYMAMIEGGFEKRGEIIRLVQTLRGGDRPKNAHKEFASVTVMPRSCWEPWGLFRKPCEGRVQDNLRKWSTGGLRRISNDQPFTDLIKSAPTRGIEREIAPHPSLKPQAFMRQIVRAALPLGEGIVLDPFMGGGSTIAAACAVGYRSIGIESDPEFHKIAVEAIPRLAALVLNGESNGVPRRSYPVVADQELALFK
jgi:site-specific DNA-methyltransferase (adenine-specific)